MAKVQVAHVNVPCQIEKVVYSHSPSELENDSRFYVYIFRDEEPFYVGKGRMRRAYQHETYAANNTYNFPVPNYLRKCWRNGKAVYCDIVRFFDSEDDALEYEEALIKRYGRRNTGTGTLVNLTDGGEANAGVIRTDEWRFNKSIEVKKKFADPTNHPRYGVKLSRQTRAKISKALMGNQPSPESIRKSALARTGKKRGPMSEEQKEKLRSVKKGKVSWTYQWEVTSPDNRKYIVMNLKQFCRDNNLNQGNMYQVAKGSKVSDKGWVCRKISNNRFIPERG